MDRETSEKINDGFKMIVLPSHLNPESPEGETLVLIFTIDELERARRRAELTIKARMQKGKSRDEIIRECLKIS